MFPSASPWARPRLPSWPTDCRNPLPDTSFVTSPESGGSQPTSSLARKRPRLLPVYDQVVRCVLGQPEAF
ncbi:DUF6308 family protein [Streptomyces asoensis]|uniref:DUF6308 family protein n=1 Tax=Streptomyces asoensis TaxID=249586 RepID=UPI0033DC406B